MRTAHALDCEIPAGHGSGSFVRGKAELKIHTVIGITGNTKSIKIYPGKTADIKTMRLGSWVKDNILLFDLGFLQVSDVQPD